MPLKPWRHVLVDAGCCTKGKSIWSLDQLDQSGGDKKLCGRRHISSTVQCTLLQHLHYMYKNSSKEFNATKQHKYHHANYPSHFTYMPLLFIRFWFSGMCCLLTQTPRMCFSLQSLFRLGCSAIAKKVTIWYRQVIYLFIYFWPEHRQIICV